MSNRGRILLEPSVVYSENGFKCETKISKVDIIYTDIRTYIEEDQRN